MEKKYRITIKAGAVMVGCLILYCKMLTDPAPTFWAIGLALSLAVVGVHLTGGLRLLNLRRKITLIPSGLGKGKGTEKPPAEGEG